MFEKRTNSGERQRKMKTTIEKDEITFSVTSYYDPYGDKKSPRVVYKREFYKTKKTQEEITRIFNMKNESRSYYGALTLSFPSRPYKRVKDFDVKN